jgi:hypothetical protein
MIDTTARRQEFSPGIGVTIMSNITAQVSVELSQASGVPRHQQTVGMANQQRNVFDLNMFSHYQLFPINASTSSSTRPAPVPLTQLMDPALSGDEDDDGGPTCVSKINATLEAPRVVYMDANTMEVLSTSIQCTTPRVYLTGTLAQHGSPMSTWCLCLKSVTMDTPLHPSTYYTVSVTVHHP